MAYDIVEPFGEQRSELRHGQQMALHANINRDSGKRSDPFTALEFMNYSDHLKDVEKQEPTPEEINEKLKHIFG